MDFLPAAMAAAAAASAAMPQAPGVLAPISMVLPAVAPALPQDASQMLSTSTMYSPHAPSLHLQMPNLSLSASSGKLHGGSADAVSAEGQLAVSRSASSLLEVVEDEQQQQQQQQQWGQQQKPASKLQRRLSLGGALPSPSLLPRVDPATWLSPGGPVAAASPAGAFGRHHQGEVTPGLEGLAHGSFWNRSRLAIEAASVLRANDLGGYTIPASGLYPYQWNWDSALVAMGWSAVDGMRAWEELDKLFSAQWDDGMVPHIVFHQASPTYFPGPEIWGTPEKPMGSTGITQPPIAATAVRHLVEEQAGASRPLGSSSGGLDGSWLSVSNANSRNTSGFGGDGEFVLGGKNPGFSSGFGMEGSSGYAMNPLEKARELFPKLLAYHRWFYSARDPHGSGLVATLHPWESGMDNSPAWDAPLAAVPVDNIPPYTRRDLGHVDAAMRPKQAEYDRYLTLLYRFRSVDYDPSKLYDLSPFRVSDVCTNSLLHRANLDLRWLAESLGEREETLAEIDGWLAKSGAAFDSLWDEEAKIYRSVDQITGKPLEAATSGGFLPLFARVASEEQAAALAGTLEEWLAEVRYGVPSLDPRDSRFEGLRYWRGPVWAIVNFMIVDGLRYYGYDALADRIEQNTSELVNESGLYEYYDPVTGQGAGGNNFSWTAAMALAWLDKQPTLQPQQQGQKAFVVPSVPQNPVVPSLAEVLPAAIQSALENSLTRSATEEATPGLRSLDIGTTVLVGSGGADAN